MSADKLTDKEYMLLIESLNCVVAKKKIFSVSESSFVRVPRSFIWIRNHTNKLST